MEQWPSGFGAGFLIQGFCIWNHWVAPRLTQPFILLRRIKWVPGISGNIVVKSKLAPWSGSTRHEVTEPHPWKRVINFFIVILFWLRCWIPNPGVPCSKPLGSSKVDSAFHPSEVDKVSTRNFWGLVVKSKLPPRSGSRLEAVEPHP